MEKEFKVRLAAVISSILISTLIMGFKFYVYKITNSSAILSDALESIINIVASIFALGSIILAAKPADKSHPYGHGKIEYFSAGFEGALIVLASIGIFKIGWERIFTPQVLPNLSEGTLLLLLASVVNLILGLALIYVGKKTNSLTLIADGKHVLTDVYTSGGVVLGLFVVNITGWNKGDGVIACIVGLNIVITGVLLIRQSFSRLMDASDPELLETISELLFKNKKDLWIHVHELRAWQSGNFLHIDLHLILPRDLPLELAHKESEEIEKILFSNFAGKASALIHLDPCIDQDCPICKKHICKLRTTDLNSEIIWNQEALTSYGKI
ncbi:MAG: cation transporter [Desulfobacterales bacterium]|nr:cation transporter [Desulfobacterales bacterium]